MTTSLINYWALPAVYTTTVLVLLLFLTLNNEIEIVKCESLGGSSSGGGGYYIKLFDFLKVCPLQSFCLPWNFKNTSMYVYSLFTQLCDNSVA